MARIMHVITGLGRGGAETMLLKLMAARGKDVDPIVVFLDGNERALEPVLRELGLPVICLDMSRSMPNPVSVFAIRRIVRRYSPQLIQGWMPYGNLMATLAGFGSTVRAQVLWNIRMSLSEIGAEPGHTKAIIRLGAMLSWQPKAIIYNSLAGAEQHEAAGYHSEKRVFIPNGFDCEVFSPDEGARRRLRQQLGISEESILIGLIARYHPMKDHAGFLQAAAAVIKNNSNLRFVLAGKNVDQRQTALSLLISELKLDRHVFLLGERNDIPQLTAALDIACSASFWGEGFSNAIGEAMACGVPCVVTDIGDSARIVAGTGLIVPARNPAAMAGAISELIVAGRERRRQLGAAARQRVELEFSLPVIVRRYEELYREYLKPARPAEPAPNSVSRAGTR